MDNKEGMLADKLERLFEDVRKPDGSKYTQTEVVEGPNGVLTRVYLWKLRTGQATNPGFHIIKAIAGFFGVHTTCFSGSEEASEAEYSTQRGRYVDEIQARAYQMDERSRKAILDLMDFILSTQKSELPGDMDSGTRHPGVENPA
jgi:transcriptional regulator with XRE-family HTH domain